MTAATGQFATPRWPNMYPALSTCNWTILAPPGANVKIVFTSLKLEDHVGSDCRTAYDKLDIYDIVNTTTTNLLETFCGTRESLEITEEGNISVVFSSDNRVQAEGFHAWYYISAPSTTSAPTTKLTTTVTTTPQLPENEYFTRTSTNVNYTVHNNDSSRLINMSIQAHIIDSNINESSVKLAMTGKDLNDNKDDVIKLTAIFVEPDLHNYNSGNSTYEFDGETGKYQFKSILERLYSSPKF